MSEEDQVMLIENVQIKYISKHNEVLEEQSGSALDGLFPLISNQNKIHYHYFLDLMSFCFLNSKDRGRVLNFESLQYLKQTDISSPLK